MKTKVEKIVEENAKLAYRSYFKQNWKLKNLSFCRNFLKRWLLEFHQYLEQVFLTDNFFGNLS